MGKESGFRDFMNRLNIGLIGTGVRGIAVAESMKKSFPGITGVTALADTNPVRLNAASEDLNVPKERCFIDYNDLLALDDVDAVIVATPDFAHVHPSVRALQAGKYVYCEKAMATTIEDANSMVQAAKSSGKFLYAGHNMRFMSALAKVNELIKAGEIGNVKMVWARRFVEGSKYFHRWHRYQEKSGGLLVHKGSHLLDQLNWNSFSRPISVIASGGLDVYKAREDAPRRCKDCPERYECSHAWNIEQGNSKRYYLDAEKEDGYIWDTCIYYPGSDVFDNATVMIEYANGVRATYMECHFAPLSDKDSEVGVMGDEGMVIGNFSKNVTILKKMATKEVVTFELPRNVGGHGGADELITRDFVDCILKGRYPESDVEAGWDSAILGIAAMRSAREGRKLKIDPVNHEVK